MASRPFGVWWSPTGKAHVGSRGGTAICGFGLDRGAEEWHAGDNIRDPDRSFAALCGRCMQKLRGQGPWADMDGWVRPPNLLQVHLSRSAEAWLLNEETWRRLIALANGQRLTRESVVQIAIAAEDALKDSARQHVANALHAVVLVPWGAMVQHGWCPDATKGLQDDPPDTTTLLIAFMQATNWVYVAEILGTLGASGGRGL
jgi:hypothetical protein